jgi:hypothetical protein
MKFLSVEYAPPVFMIAFDKILILIYVLLLTLILNCYACMIVFDVLFLILNLKPYSLILI